MASPRRFTATGSGIIKITWQKLLSVVKHFGIKYYHFCDVLPCYPVFILKYLDRYDSSALIIYGSAIWVDFVRKLIMPSLSEVLQSTLATLTFILNGPDSMQGIIL